MNKKKGKVAVLITGRGSNFEAIYKNSHKPDSNYQIDLVISNKKKARGLITAREFGIDAYYVRRKSPGSRQDYETEIVKILTGHQIELVCLAGYMKIVGKTLLDAFKDKIINIHPSLLPSFPGFEAQKQALTYGVKISGCTVHFVNAGIDTGPIILQSMVRVLEDDTVETLSNRILKEEHVLFSQAIKLFFDDKLEIINQRSVKIK
jgi:phosphoribosylglycinamide formyltransferase-1